MDKFKSNDQFLTYDAVYFIQGLIEQIFQL